MRYMQADEWIAQQEQRTQAHQQARRRRRPIQVLSFPVPTAPIEPTLAETHAELLNRIDAAVAELRRQPKRKLAGRRMALLEHRELAEEIRQLCVDHSPSEVLGMLEISRQGLQDTWTHHGLAAPRFCRAQGPRPGRETP